MGADSRLEGFLDHLADRIANRVSDRLSDSPAHPSVRLLTVDQAAEYLGRTKTAVQHMIAQRKIPVVKSDRRCFVDVRDLDRWIEDNKQI